MLQSLLWTYVRKQSLILQFLCVDVRKVTQFKYYNPFVVDVRKVAEFNVTIFDVDVRKVTKFNLTFFVVDVRKVTQF